MRVGLGVAVVLGAVLAFACGPEVKVSHRHLAEQWCREHVDLQERCDLPVSGNPLDWPEEEKVEKREKCESDPAWDWTDECGDKMWAFRECMNSIPCELYPQRTELKYEDERLCYPEEVAFFGICKSSEDHGG